MQRLASNQTTRKALSLRYNHHCGCLPSFSLNRNPPCYDYDAGSASPVFASAGARGRRFTSQRTVASFSSSPLVSSSLSSSIIEDDHIDDEPLSSHMHGHAHHSPNVYSHQRGYGKIVALSSQPSSSSPISTYLTDLRHSSPMRLVPSRRSHPTPAHQQKEEQRTHEAALLHLSSYGGGLVPGDSLHIDVDVRGHGAVVCILTQGGQRIYRPGKHFGSYESYNYDRVSATSQNVTEKENEKASASKLCQSTIQCTVEPGATLMYLPDPTVPYYQSSFQERREFTCQYEPKSNDTSHNTQNGSHIEKEEISSMGSIIAVDWYSSGRRFSTGMEEERWAFDYLSTRTELFVEPQHQTQTGTQKQRTRPSLIESVIFDNALSGERNSSMRTPAAIALGQNFDSMATLTLHGPTSLPVAERAKSLSRHLASLRTRTRSEYSFDDDFKDAGEEEGDNELEKLLGALGGKVLLSVTPIKHSNGHLEKEQVQPLTHMVRIMAECNEDIYRVFHHCLKPCSKYLGGLQPYRDRIHSSKTVRSKSILPEKQMNASAKTTRQSQQIDMRKSTDLHSIANQLVFGKDISSNSFSSEAWFRLCTLSDSSLPVGSFAHSLGVEAASQMGLFLGEGDNAGNGNEGKPWSPSDDASSCSTEALSDYIHGVSRSNARFSVPQILAGYSLLVPSTTSVSTPMHTMDVKRVHQSWLGIDDYIDRLLLTNEPGRRASTDQGLGLLRISPSFAGNDGLAPQNRETMELWNLIRQSVDTSMTGNMSGQSDSTITPSDIANGHAAPIYGILSASLGIPPLDACRVFAFGAARDTVSAAVRLNLVGPMEGLTILDGVGRSAVEEGLEEGLVGMLPSGTQHGTKETQLEHWLRSVATCAPVMDTVQPLHDLLSVRLFRT